MGKKKGQQHRTKGNVLPSSSVRSADLLMKESGHGLFPSSFSTGLGNVPELAGLESIVNVEFRTVLKKLYKRDVTTKLKGLIEFSDLCRSCKQHEVLTVLPYWPRVYNKLFEDSDRRVRESAQKAMNAIAEASGKNLALQLKNIMGCWFVSQCDPYSPASMTADAAIARAFSNNKKIEAFVFCRKDILKTIVSFLFDSHSMREKLSDHEANNFHRILASSLEALSLFIQTVTRHVPDKDELEDILGNNKFWKFQKHSNDYVRGGFYSTVESLCLVSSTVLEPHITEACKSIFHRLNESSAIVCKPLYAAAVAIVSTFANWHESTDINKGVIPGLCAILKAGCHGLGSIVLPSLLPIFAKLPSLSDLIHIFSKMFESLIICLDQDQIRLSRHGSEQVISTHVELLRLLVSRVATNEYTTEMILDITKIVIEENLMKIITNQVAGGGNKLASDIVFIRVSEVIYAWTTKMLDSTSPEIYSKLIESFWSSANEFVGRHIKEENIQVVQMIIKFLNKLYNHQPVNVKNVRRSVKFNAVSTEECHEGNHVATKDEPSEAQIRMREKINQIMLESDLLIAFKDSKDMLNLYIQVFKNLGSSELFKSIVSKTKSQQSKEEVDVGLQASDYIEHILLPEVERILNELECGNDSETCQLFSNLVFSAVIHCEQLDDFPIDLSKFLLLKVDDPRFVVVLQLLAMLTAEVSKSPKIGIWMERFFSDNDSSMVKYFASLIECLAQCTCDVVVKTCLSNSTWSLLQNFMISSYEENGQFNLLCSEDSFVRTIFELKQKLENVKTDCVLRKCFTSYLLRFASLMLHCADHTYVEQLSKADGNIWEVILTLLLHTYFTIEETMPSLLSLFAKYFALAKTALPPFLNNSAIDVNSYISSQASWIKHSVILSNSYNMLDISTRVKHWSDVILSNNESEETKSASLVCVKNILPSSQEWSIIRGFDTDESSYESVGCLSVKSVNERYQSVIDLCKEVIAHMQSSYLDNSLGVAWDQLNEIFTLMEEYVISSAVTNHELDDKYVNSFGPTFKVRLKKNILNQSMTIGGIWPLCVKKLGQYFDHNELKFVIDTVFNVCESGSKIESSLFETMKSLILNLSQDMISEMSTKLFNNLHSNLSIDLSISQIYRNYSLGISLLYEVSSKEVKNEFIQKYLDQTVTWRSNREELFLFDDNFPATSTELVLLNYDFAKLFTLVVTFLGDILSESQWDLICCSVVSWMENIANYIEKEDMIDTAVLKLLKMSCELKEVIEKFMVSPAVIADPTIPQNLFSEWTEFFSLSVYSSLVKIFLNICGRDIEDSSILGVCQSLRKVPVKSILESSSNLKPHLTVDSPLPDEIQTLLYYLCPLLYPLKSVGLHTNMIQLTAFNLILTILDKLVTKETTTSPDAIFNIIKKSAKDIESFFIVKEVGGMKANTESDSDESVSSENEEEVGSFQLGIEENITPVLGYLLSYKILIRMTAHVFAENKMVFIENLMKGKMNNMADDLLPKLFKLMVDQINHFKTEPELICEGILNFDQVEHIAASVYKDFLVQMPAASRSWFNDLSKGTRSRVDKFTSSFVSPVLIAQEFKAVQLTKQQQNVEGMEIIARPSAREVHAAYRLNEVQMEIVVCLSANHPLGPITVNTEKRAGILMGQWRYWILQITTFLQYQNGGIIDGLLLWKDKVDKRFEGLEECMICFSVVHGSSQSLPKLKCKTCKKKYHAECLYKWFDTSNNSTCPICRSPMIFR